MSGPMVHHFLEGNRSENVSRLVLTRDCVLRPDEGNYHVQAWSTPCILIAGTNPSELVLQRSFEIYRGSQRDVLVITFDELLAN